MSTFATKAEALAACHALRETLGRLPGASSAEMEYVTAAVQHVEQALGAFAEVDPADAGGTHRYREVHGLPAIEGTRNV